MRNENLKNIPNPNNPMKPKIEIQISGPASHLIIIIRSKHEIIENPNPIDMGIHFLSNNSHIFLPNCNQNASEYKFQLN